MNFTLTQIANKTGGTLKGRDMSVTNLVTDSRKVTDGSLFAVIKGERVDGMDFINGIDGKFDVAYLTDRPVENTKNPYILVPDVIKAIGDIASLYIETLDTKRIAVTGSVGKTTTKNYIASALGACVEVHYSKGNNNNELGMPLTVLDTKPSHDAAIFEMGMRGLGQIEYLCNIAKPDVAVITNVGICHIELLGSRENILKAKWEIVDCLKDDGICVINGDDDMLCKGVTNKKVVRYGIENKDCDILAKNVVNNKFDLVYNGKSYPVTLSLLGIHNVYNCLAAVAVGISLGYDVEKLISGAESFAGDGSRQNIYMFDGYRIFDDTYNASPDSMRASMKVMKTFEGRKVLVLADMLELGDFAEKAHTDLAKDVQDIDAGVVICIGDHMKHLAKALQNRKNVYSCPDNERALEILNETVQKGDNILFKGSNSMKLNELLNSFKGDKQ